MTEGWDKIVSEWVNLYVRKNSGFERVFLFQEYIAYVLVYRWIYFFFFFHLYTYNNVGESVVLLSYVHMHSIRSFKESQNPTGVRNREDEITVFRLCTYCTTKNKQTNKQTTKQTKYKLFYLLTIIIVINIIIFFKINK